MAKAKAAKKTETPESIGATIAQTVVAQPGDNSGANPQLQEIFAAHLEADERKREFSKAQRDGKAKAKVEFGVTGAVFSEIIRRMKMDRDVRIQYESGIADVNVMLGYQASLDLRNDTIPRTEEEYVDPTHVATGLINRHH